MASELVSRTSPFSPLVHLVLGARVSPTAVPPIRLSPIMSPGNLEVNVLDGTRLRETQVFGKQDPYCVVRVGETRDRTKTCTDGGSRPKWNERFNFTLAGHEQAMDLEVWNRNSMTSDSYIGAALVSLSEVFAAGSSNVQVTLKDKKGKNAGSVVLVLRFNGAGVSVAPNLAPSQPTHHQVHNMQHAQQHQQSHQAHMQYHQPPPGYPAQPHGVYQQPMALQQPMQQPMHPMHQQPPHMAHAPYGTQPTYVHAPQNGYPSAPPGDDRWFNDEPAPAYGHPPQNGYAGRPPQNGYQAQPGYGQPPPQQKNDGWF